MAGGSALQNAAKEAETRRKLEAAEEDQKEGKRQAPPLPLLVSATTGGPR